MQPFPPSGSALHETPNLHRICVSVQTNFLWVGFNVTCIGSGVTWVCVQAYLYVWARKYIHEFEGVHVWMCEPLCVCVCVSVHLCTIFGVCVCNCACLRVHLWVCCHNTYTDRPDIYHILKGVLWPQWFVFSLISDSGCCTGLWKPVTVKAKMGFVLVVFQGEPGKSGPRGEAVSRQTDTSWLFITIHVLTHAVVS